MSRKKPQMSTFIAASETRLIHNPRRYSVDELESVCNQYGCKFTFVTLDDYLNCRRHHVLAGSFLRDARAEIAELREFLDDSASYHQKESSKSLRALEDSLHDVMAQLQLCRHAAFHTCHNFQVKLLDGVISHLEDLLPTNDIGEHMQALLLSG